MIIPLCSQLRAAARSCQTICLFSVSMQDCVSRLNSQFLGQQPVGNAVSQRKRWVMLWAALEANA